MFADVIYEKIAECGNPTVLGLDPRVEYVPDSIKEKTKNDAAAVLEFNIKLIDALGDIVHIVKFQSAYYEILGPAGAITLQNSIAYAKEAGMIVILDAKRNDIGSTAQAYADAYLSDTHYSADALTVNGYLGTDGIKPFIDMCKENGKGIFILVKTSNPSSGELQDLKLESGITVYEKMAELVNNWGADVVGKNGYSSVGAVVGATYPEELGKLRQMMPKAMLLIPGYGAQGGGADDVKNGFDANGNGAIVNSSRGLMCAWKLDKFSGKYTHEDFCEAARAEAVLMKNSLTTVI
ncbi:MAG: orotidine-5'-phosphate decarboxylase [Clostridiales bacterium]|nr:orotidine-5'-phosphate decarboxylase [Clostridiales bacterium]